MIKFKLVDNRTRVAKRIKELQDKVEALPKVMFKEIVDMVVELSPVDTGTYIDAHQIGEQSSPTSSKGKPRNQNEEAFKQKAKERLYAQIDAMPLEERRIYISNNAEHAWVVEYGKTMPNGNFVGGQSPYTQTRAAAPRLLEQAKSKVGLT